MKTTTTTLNKMHEFYGTDKRYNQFSAYLKHKFGQKVYKITLDAGFNCPNRDGTISTGGCIFCDDGGSFSRAHSNLLTIEEQIQTGIKNLSEKFKAQKFMSYFQAYTNTYKPVEELEEIYNSALNHPDIVGISIGTRPDCVDKKKLDLIASYTKNYETWIEYGLQSVHDRTLQYINRGHDYKTFEHACEETKKRDIKVCVHVILGLPYETKEDMLKTAKTLANLGVDGVKIHDLCVMKNTKLAKMYEEQEIALLEEDEYVSLVCDFLEVLPPETTIHRLAGNGLQELKIAPLWLNKKFEILNKIDRELIKRNSWQGKLYKN